LLSSAAILIYEVEVNQDVMRIEVI